MIELKSHDQVGYSKLKDNRVKGEFKVWLQQFNWLPLVALDEVWMSLYGEWKIHTCQDLVSFSMFSPIIQVLTLA